MLGKGLWKPNIPSLLFPRRISHAVRTIQYKCEQFLSCYSNVRADNWCNFSVFQFCWPFFGRNSKLKIYKPEIPLILFFKHIVHTVRTIQAKIERFLSWLFRVMVDYRNNFGVISSFLGLFRTKVKKKDTKAQNAIRIVFKASS